jgi:hypothetical protein
MDSFRNDRYTKLNSARWNHFLAMGIPLAGKTVFEPGAGVGDHTEFLLNHGAQHVIFNEGRPENLQVARERFGSDPRVSFVLGDLETDLDKPEFQFTVDLIYFYGIYNHLNETVPEFHIMRGLARIGETIAFDYITGNDAIEGWSKEYPASPVSCKAFQPKTETLFKGLKGIWPYVYKPKNALVWVDGMDHGQRTVGVASKVPQNNTELVLQ